MVRTIHVSKVLDDSRELIIPVPTDLHAGDKVDVEVIFRHPSPSGKSWRELLDQVEGIFSDHPLEIPLDPPPTPIAFEE